ncbi:MAG: ACT domain-containing protein [Candidatus Wallbacteria bacterium]
MENQDRVVVTVIGVNRSGIVSKISSTIAEFGASIADISQTLMGELFVMIMVIDVSRTNLEFKYVKEKLEKSAEEIGVKAMVLHENTFKYMHRV